MWASTALRGPRDAGHRVSDQTSGNHTRSYLYDPVPTADLHTMSAFMRENEQNQQQGQQFPMQQTLPQPFPAPQQPASGSNEGKLEHLQDVAGLKMMVMQLEKAREAMSQEKKKKDSFSWSHVLFEFSQNTTMHGLSKTTEDTPFLLRRMIWILVVLGGVSLFLYQLWTSVMTYLSYPVTVNVQINYNKSLDFPAVTICNLNVFRTTKAAELNYYDLINKIYDPARTEDILADEIPDGMTLEKLYKELVHDKYDMIKSCRWDSKECSADDFVTTTTDHGVCQTFNTGRNGMVLNVTQTGSNHGLHVRLNVEQYEYMRGPNKGAGIKVLVHGREDVPLVRDLGQAIAPGAHAFVGIQLKKMTNLQPPFGECDDSQQLHFYPVYSQSACSIDCLEHYLEKECHCRLMHMPKDQYQDFPEICSMDKFINCVPAALDKFNTARVHVCRCPVPCQSQIYDASVTYASTSHFDNDQVLQSAETATLTMKYIGAKEVTQRVDKQLVERDKLLVTNLVAASRKVDVSIRAINHNLAEAHSSLENINDEMYHRAIFHNHVLTKSIQGYRYWFGQGWEITSKIMDELIGGHTGFIKKYNNTMQALVDKERQESFRDILKWQIEQAAYERFSIADEVRNKTETVQSTYNNCKPMFDYDVNFAKAYIDFLLPVTAIQQRKKITLEVYDDMRKYILSIIEGYHKLFNETKRVGVVKEYHFNLTSFNNISATLNDDLKELNHWQEMYHREVVHHIGDLLNDGKATFEGAMAEMEEQSKDLLNTLTKIQSELNDIEQDWKVVNAFIKDSQKYLSSHDIGKLDLSYTVNKIHNEVENMRNFFTDMRSRAQNLDHDWTKVLDMYKVGMKLITTDKNTKKLYLKLNEDFKLMLSSSNKTLKKIMWDYLPKPKQRGNIIWLGKDIWQYQTYANLDTAHMNEADVDHLVHILREEVNNSSDIYRGSDFFGAFDDWEMVLDDFNASTKVDSSFYRENFIDLDIYFIELYYEEINQQQAYDLTSLFCSDHGLRVRLNVEQYEYMRGPNKGAGIKVLVHGREDVPLVRDLGQAIAPGAHAFIGIQLKKMTNLQPPFGECDDKQKLHFYPTYTQSACSVDCLERYLDSECKCRLLYMPKDQYHDYPDVCSMDQFVNCVPKALESFNVQRVQRCRCPVPCQKLIYSASVTYASTSHFDTDQVLQTADTSTLQTKYIAAKEVHQRVDKQVARHDKLLVENLIAASGKIDVTIKAINQSLADAHTSMESLYNEMKHRAFFHKYVLRKIIQGYQYWFVQGWELTSKMIDELIGGHAGFLKTYNNTMSALSQKNHRQSFKEVLIWQIMQEASERYHLANMVTKEFQLVQESLTNCTPMFEYGINFAKAYVQLLLPETVIQERRTYSFTLFDFNYEYLQNITGRYHILLDAVNQVSINTTYNYDMNAFKSITKDLLEDVNSLNHGQKTYEREVVHYPNKLLEKGRNKFEGAIAELDKECDDLLNTLKKTHSLLNNIERNWEGVKMFIKDSKKYVESEEVGKSALSYEVNRIDNQVEAMRTFFTDVRSRARNLDHDWTKVFIMFENAMKELVTEKSTKLLYAKLHEDVKLMLSSTNQTFIKEMWKELPFPQTPGNGKADEEWLGNDRWQYMTYANLDMAYMNETDVDNLVVYLRGKVNNSSDIYKAIGDKDINFFAAFDEWEKDLDYFNTSTKVDGSFFRENFIDLDIYLTEMYYEEIHQQQAYDLTSLFSDIGGSMGLFIGASVITVIELIDIIFLSLFKTKCSCRA